MKVETLGFFYEQRLAKTNIDSKHSMGKKLHPHKRVTKHPCPKSVPNLNTKFGKAAIRL